MNRSISLVALGLLLLSSATAAPRTLDQIRASGTLRLGTEGAFPPFNFYEKKNLVGFEIDLGTALAAQLKLKPAWVVQPFDGLLIALNQGRFDAVIASHAITPERQKAVDFLKPHYCSTVNIVAKVGGPLSRQALGGKSVGVQVGTAQIPILKAVAGIGAVKTYPNDQVALSSLQAGRIDAWSSNGPVVAYMLKQTGLQGRVQIGEVISNERNAMAVSKGNTALLGALDAALATVQANGTYAKISQQWFGRDIRCK
jgi:polar amino acid transport system substrate-binding protein